MADKAEDAAVTHKHPSTISRLFESKDNAKVRDAHIAHYGFDIPEQFATDLAAYIKKPGPLPSMFRGDTSTLRAQIRSVYGFDVSDQYAADLMAFVKKEAAPDVPRK